MKIMTGAASALLVLFGSGFAQAQTTLYATGNDTPHVGLFTVNPATGIVTWTGTTPSDAILDSGGLTYDELTSTLYATGYDNASQSAFYSLNPTTGAAVKIAQIPASPVYNISLGGLAFDSTARILYASGTDGQQGTSLFTINPANGAITHIGLGNQSIPFVSGLGSTSPVNLYGLGYDPSSDTLYANGSILFDSSLSSSLFTVNRLTGVPTWIGYSGVTAGRSLSYSGIAYDPVSGALYSMGSITGASEGLYTISTATGLATLVSTFSTRIGADGGLAFISAIPEASTCSLFAGLAVLAIVTVRKKQITTKRQVPADLRAL